MKKILIIEDDPDIVDLIEIHLKDLHCLVDKCYDGEKGLEMALSGDYNLIVLDLMLPGMDGIQVCQQLRIKQVNTPLMMLTAKSEEIDRVLGLEIGADDYIVKPFSVREFIARVKAQLRRVQLDRDIEGNPAKTVLRHNDLMIDIEKRKVEVDQKNIDLSPKEFELLLVLASHPGRSYTRANLLNQVWGYDFDGFEHTVNSHINRLRAKIEPDMANPKYILTSWGVGYKFNDEIAETNQNSK
jgi:DNA-binding response OmpR family regulator